MIGDLVDAHGLSLSLALDFMLAQAAFLVDGALN
jgi:hypothetical protein